MLRIHYTSFCQCNINTIAALVPGVDV